MNGYTFGRFSKGDSFEEYAVLNKGNLRRETAVVRERADLLSFGIDDI